MTWLSGIFVGLYLTGVVLFGKHQPGSDFTKVGSFYVTVVNNTSNDSVLVAVVAPRVDSVIRPLGVLAPHDSGWAKLPYGDPPLILLYINVRGAGWWHDVPPDSVFFRSDSAGPP